MNIYSTLNIYACALGTFFVFLTSCAGESAQDDRQFGERTSEISSHRGSESDEARIMTVNGWIQPTELGTTLPHEHVLVDFAGAEHAYPPRYDIDSAYQVILPYLDAAVSMGMHALVECTPAYLGRDPLLLSRLSDATGLHLLTNTGYYAARNNQFVPAEALDVHPDTLASTWIAEWNNGIDGTGIKPGFIKIGVDGGPLSDVATRIVRAAARTHLASGLTIAAHTGDAEAALQQVELMSEEGIDLSAWIWVHAQNGPDLAVHLDLAQRGAWISFDGLSEGNVGNYVRRLEYMKENHALDQVLVSHDAGWYHVGEPGGGSYRGYETLFRSLLPALQAAGFSDMDIRQLTVTNPAQAYRVHVRRAKP